MSTLSAPIVRSASPDGTPLRRELVKVSAFFLRNWRMTHRNVFTVFEIVFWPIVNLLSVGLLITFLGAEPGTVVFVLVGTFALSTVQVCQLDVAYAALFDMWSKSIKHQLVAPIRPWHLVLGSWLMGLVRGTAVFALQAAMSHWVFGVNVLAHGPGPAAALVAGLLLSAAGVGLFVSTLLMLFGLRAEVSAWSGVSLILLLCGVYYPVSVLPAPLQTMAAGVPLTHFLEAFRAHLGYAPVFTAPLLRGYALAVVYAAGGYALFAWAIHRARRTGMLLRLSD
ncbi:MAG TPA: ABC transporter permease [Methylomirabilota bacterium]|jgi:ABC-2 type transport system permease protein|nr:ABC transporter permease [Methylomirabilota bacterium]